MGVKHSYLVTTLVIGVIIGIFFGDYENIGCESTTYCAQKDLTNLRRSF
jgi:hypothetical protein